MPPSEMTARQLAVASLIAQGLTNQQIAGALQMSDRRVRVHVTALAFLLKLDEGKDVRVQIALWWREHMPVSTAA